MKIYAFPVTELAAGAHAVFRCIFDRPAKPHTLAFSDECVETLWVKQIEVAGDSVLMVPMPARAFGGERSFERKAREDAILANVCEDVAFVAGGALVAFTCALCGSMISGALREDIEREDIEHAGDCALRTPDRLRLEMPQLIAGGEIAILIENRSEVSVSVQAAVICSEER